MRLETIGARLAFATMLFAGLPVCAQDLPLNMTSPLDPTRAITAPVLQGSRHQPLPEEYVWTASNPSAEVGQIYHFPRTTEQIEPHFFRAKFNLAAVPKDATLYLAGPRAVQVWINGVLAESVQSDLTSPLGMHIFSTPVAAFLHPGANVIAIRAVRGRGVSGFANSALVRQQTFGQVLVAKILPSAQGIQAPPILISDASWMGSELDEGNWHDLNFSELGWKPVQHLGGIESSIEMFQWNADAGLYDWPGYDGISPFLAHVPIAATAVLATYLGSGNMLNQHRLLGRSGGDFTVTMPATMTGDAGAPSIALDFGRELTGRVEIVSDSDQPVTVSVQMGESEAEAMKAPFLGVNQMTIAPHGTGYSPKTAFRYAKIRFLAGAPQIRFKSIGVDHIYYPVTYAGSFESSDALLNRVWEVGAYTAHLCMQDGVWDASKRDRGRWMGDTDVSGRVIEEVFGEHPLMEDTLDRLMGPAPVTQHVNGIPGYSSFWFTGVADYYRHTGSKAFLEREHDRMVQLLAFVDHEFDERSVYANTSKVWLYVDWSPDLNGDTPETRRATTLEFYRAYREAAYLLRELNDTANAAKYEARAAKIKAGAEQYLLTPATGTYGPRWETNAAAVMGDAAGPERYPDLWKNVFSQVGKGDTHGLIISPYYNFYVIKAMAQLGHRPEALAWIRQYWGGMLSEGATSFWEAYDPSWYKEDFHASLQSDNRSGYFVSLAHGWSAGPTAWLMEEVLGIQPTGAGFNTVDIRPDLAGLAWARGAEPTPHGLLKVDAHQDGSGIKLILDLPAGIRARLSLPGITVSDARGVVPTQGTDADSRSLITLDQPGHYEFTSR